MKKEPIKLTELIAAIGDDAIKCQFLDQCFEAIDWNGKTGLSKITFGTDQPIIFDQAFAGRFRDFGIVVWAPREIVEAFTKGEKPAAKPDYEEAWKSLIDPLKWMQDNDALKAYLGWNLAEIANDLIARAYPSIGAPASDEPHNPPQPRDIDAAEMRDKCIEIVKQAKYHEGSDHPVCNSIIYSMKQISIGSAVADGEKPFGLTPREYDVMVCVAEGLENAEIGRRLDIKERTVRIHLEVAVQKIGAGTRVACAVAFDRATRP